MKIGIVDTIFADSSMEEVLERAARLGYAHVEMAAWPKLTGEQVSTLKNRYTKTPPALLNYFTGITHLDIDELDDERTGYVKGLQAKTGVEISALSYYGNPMDPDPDLRGRSFEHLHNMVDACVRLGIGRINTFIGRDPRLNNEENLALAIELWTPVIRHAEEAKVQVAIEQCPMFFTSEQWPNGLNMFTSPRVWRAMFDAIPSDYFGLCYDPSHMEWQQMDAYKPILDFADKIFCVHIKDAKIMREKINEVGILAYPLEYYRPVLPGLGDLDWGKYFGTLNDIGFDGYAYVEIEDEAFTGSDEGIDRALTIAMDNTMRYVL